MRIGQSVLLALSLYLMPLSAWAKSQSPGAHVPDEIESVGGHALGLGNDGVAALSEQASIRTNPAMITFEKHYRLSAGYHWPTYGREFYQIGVVDSKTSPLAAGVLYTQSQIPYESYEADESDHSRRLNRFFDSPIKRRLSLGVGQAFSKMAFGLGMQYMERHDGEETTKGTTMGVGLAGLLTPSLRFGVSAENLANNQFYDVAPKTLRIGLAYTLFGGDVTAHLDAKQRERVPQENPNFLMAHGFSMENPIPDQDPTKPEQMVSASFTARIQDLLRLMAAYGQSVDKVSRKTLSGGVALVNTNFSLSYLVSKPYLRDEKSHQAINFSVSMSM